MGIFDMFSSFLNPQKGYQAGGKELEKYFNQSKDTMMPWINQGQEQYGKLTGAEDALLDPETLLNKWIGGYEESPYATQSKANARSGGLDAASSMGLMGSNAAVNNIENSANYITSADRDKYLDNLMQKYMSGIGIGQNIYGTGANMASNFGNMTNQMGQNMAGIKFGEQNSPGNLLEHLISIGANAYSGQNARK
jgi:hypothetical protein